MQLVIEMDNHIVLPKDIQSYKPLSHEEMTSLFLQVKKGCQKSREELIQRNLRLVLNLIHRFKKRNVSLEELFQIGMIGLIKAVDQFDLSKDVRFSTYAVPTILGEIRRFLRDNNSLKVSRHLKECGSKISAFRDEFLHLHGREPRISEIEKGTNMDHEDIVMAMNANQEVVLLSTPLYDSRESHEVTIESQLADERSLEEEWTTKETLLQAMNTLPLQEKHVLVMRYYQQKTQMEIGECLGFSQAHVSRMEKSALKKLKNII